MQEIIQEAICHEKMAYVLVPHLSSTYESRLPEIMQRISKLKIRTIETGMSIAPCTLYILPPGKYVEIRGNFFHLLIRPEEKINQSANILFKSLAKSYGPNSIGVVLSGAMAGSDGSDGIAAIKDAGGKTFAQDPETADFPSMPELEIQTGKVDYVFDALEIGRKLSSFVWQN